MTARAVWRADQASPWSRPRLLIAVKAVLLAGQYRRGYYPGVIEFRLKELARKRGITTAYQLQVAMEVDPGTAARLWKKSGGDREGISFGMIDRLCEVLD